MIDISKLPAVRAQLERDAAAKALPQDVAQPVPAEYARTPVTGEQQAVRPAAMQDSKR